MRLEVLKNEAKELLPYLEGQKDFYLAGGTAIALQIGHRISVDFDFFSKDILPKTLLTKIQKKLKPRFAVEVLVNNSEELTMLVNGVKLTYLYYPFPLIEPLFVESGLTMLSLAELAATKAYTVGRRGEGKDYIDLFYLLKDKHVDLATLLKLASKKYQTDFNDRLFLEQLLYLEDINLAGVILLNDKDLKKEQLNSFFEEEISKLKLS
ncbi:MAG: nucleotidyl transferase AbiEii/AbiGii toxin family protein [Cyanobacteria bacterium]|nr:nucleotidyl transferase AbiEii/AbiGii toxin family protein [Cyanobacteriota bacterium]